MLRGREPAATNPFPTSMTATARICLARPIDPQYPTNRAILIAAAAAAPLGLAVAAVSGGDLWGSAVGAVIGTLFAWILCREVLPDRELVAFVAAAVGFGLALGIGPPSVLTCLLWTFALRLANRSPGAAATWFDTVAVLGLTAWLALRGQPLLGLIVGVACLIDGFERDPVRRHRLVGLLALGLGIAGLVIDSGTDTADPVRVVEPIRAVELVAAAVVTLGFAVAVRTVGRSTALGDRDGQRLDPARVVAAQTLAVLGAWGVLVIAGRDGLASSGPLWAALAGAAVAALPLRGFATR